MLREDRHAVEESFVAEATRRRRRSSRASFFLVYRGDSSYDTKTLCGGCVFPQIQKYSSPCQKKWGKIEKG